jgi:lipopolysaccharide transport system ATP-binding protein
MSDIAIRVEALGKQYRIGAAQPRYKTLRESIVDRFSAPFRLLSNSKSEIRNSQSEELWALKDVSFEIKPGEVVGIIGRNGAGKSTLLKILSRITDPTEGRVEIHGRVGSLLEVGTGFHPELTGRENIFLSGAILGMRRAEIGRKFDEIVTFAEVEKFVETPVKHYSSGMYLRLAFAVAAHLEPEILLVDEVLAVGDLSFQEKCLGKMGDVSREGRTVLFVSHNLSAIWSLCPQSVWLDAGRVRARGDTEPVLDDYRRAMRSQNALALSPVATRNGSGRMRITRLALQDADGSACTTPRSGQPLSFVLEYIADAGMQLDDVEINLIVGNDRDHRLFALANKVSGERLTSLSRQGCVKCTVPSLPLVPGDYSLSFSCLLRGELADKELSAGRFSVVEGDFFGSGRLPARSLGDVLVSQRWEVVAPTDEGLLSVRSRRTSR